jgi:uncharacterized protein (TIGR02270 family)
VIIKDVVQQHAEEGAILHGIRTSLTRAPHVRLHHIGRFDDRLNAHLVGLSVAGDEAWPICDAALEFASPGVVFTAAVRAIEDRHRLRLDRLFALARALPETRPGVVSAFGWLERDRLQGIVAELLDAEGEVEREVGLAACAVHRVDPGIAAARRLHDPSLIVRARAFRAVGELGLLGGMPAAAMAIADQDPECQLWAAWSMVLLGNRGASLDALALAGLADGSDATRAFRLSLQAMDTGNAHRILQGFAHAPPQVRKLIEGSGIVGDPTYVPWLIRQMEKPQTARLAGEAFSLVTGADLDSMQLYRAQPEGVDAGPNDDPDDPNVDMDPDDGLPWPDPELVKDWWAKNSNRFQPGQRYFMGKPVTREHCIDVLKNGYQRQRILAAHYLCLLQPGTPLFNTSAPAWRQQRLLAQMS